MLRSLAPFLLASLGFTLIALVLIMPLFEWQISEVNTDLPLEFQINLSWTTKPGESLESNLYILKQVILRKDGNSCSPEHLTYVVNRSQSDETLEQIALNVNQRVTRWLTGLTFTGQSAMAVILLLCGTYIWWFAFLHNRPFPETIMFTVVAILLLAVLINVWRILTPENGVVVCLPEMHGRLSFHATLSKVHYETLIILFMGFCAEIGALVIILRQIIKFANEGKSL